MSKDELLEDMNYCPSCGSGNIGIKHCTETRPFQEYIEMICFDCRKNLKIFDLSEISSTTISYVKDSSLWKVKE